jgi:hypothetical protein
MCTPAAAIGIVSGGLGFLQQREAVKNANKAAKIQHNIEVERATEEAKNRHNQLSQEALQESQRINQQRQSLALQALQEHASLTVAAAEGGTGGVSKIRSFLSADIGEDLARSDLAINANNARFNISQNSRGIDSSKGNRIQNAFLTRQASTRRKPGALDLAIGLAGQTGVQEAGGAAISSAFASKSTGASSSSKPAHIA